MSEYTPDTKSVRNAYTYWTNQNLIARNITTRTEPELEFDRWLVQHDHEVKSYAGERIADLLERTLMPVHLKSVFEIIKAEN